MGWIRRVSAVVVVAVVALPLALRADTDRLKNAADVLTEMVGNPDNGISPDFFAKARCVVVIPGVVKAALGVGGQVRARVCELSAGRRDRMERAGGHPHRGRQHRISDRRVGHGRHSSRDERSRRRSPALEQVHGRRRCRRRRRSGRTAGVGSDRCHDEHGDAGVVAVARSVRGYLAARIHTASGQQ